MVGLPAARPLLPIDKLFLAKGGHIRDFLMLVRTAATRFGQRITQAVELFLACGRRYNPPPLPLPPGSAIFKSHSALDASTAGTRLFPKRSCRRDPRRQTDQVFRRLRRH